MSGYVRFTEYNDHEGETWHFFIPDEGNSEEIGHLRSIVNERLDEEQYQVGETITEQAVDALVASNAWDDSNYMPRFNKLSGKLVVPSDLEDDDLYDTFYKGGIRQMMK